MTMKEWKSEKELEQFILSENRNEIIGFVNTKTLRKWKVLTDPKDYDWLENMYILQKGNKYFYIRCNVCEPDEVVLKVENNINKFSNSFNLT